MLPLLLLLLPHSLQLPLPLPLLLMLLMMLLLLPMLLLLLLLLLPLASSPARWAAGAAAVDATGPASQSVRSRRGGREEAEKGDEELGGGE